MPHSASPVPIIDGSAFVFVGASFFYFQAQVVHALWIRLRKGLELLLEGEILQIPAAFLQDLKQLPHSVSPIDALERND